MYGNESKIGHMSAKWVTIQPGSQLENQQGKHRDKSFYDAHAGKYKGAPSNREIDRMVDRVEGIVKILQNQTEADRLATS